MTTIPDNYRNQMDIASDNAMSGASQADYNPTSGDQSQPVNNPEEGPAAALFTPKYTLGKNYGLVYPKNLQSSGRGHSVYFQIYETESASFTDVIQEVGKFDLGAIATEGLKVAGEGITAAANAVSQLFSNPREGIQQGLKSLSEFSNQVQITKSTKKNTAATIALYMPETVTFSQEATYGNLSLAQAAGSVPGLGKIPRGLTSILQNDAVRLTLSAGGFAFNPQQQLLFEGIDFREYDMSFTFTPSSVDETNNVNEIIKTFRYHAAPEIGGLGGFFFTPPSIFQVSFHYNGKRNENINQLKRSVLKKVDVNYAPNGWAAFDGNGAPVQTTISLSFQEIVLVDKKEIKQGF